VRCLCGGDETRLRRGGKINVSSAFLMAFSHHLHWRGSHDDVVLYTIHTRIFIIYINIISLPAYDICACTRCVGGTDVWAAPTSPRPCRSSCELGTDRINKLCAAPRHVFVVLYDHYHRRNDERTHAFARAAETGTKKKINRNTTQTVQVRRDLRRRSTQTDNIAIVVLLLLRLCIVTTTVW